MSLARRIDEKPSTKIRVREGLLMRCSGENYRVLLNIAQILTGNASCEGCTFDDGFICQRYRLPNMPDCGGPELPASEQVIFVKANPGEVM